MIRRTRKERLALRMKVVDGELHYRRLMWRDDFVDDAGIAIARLREGQAVWVLQRGPLVTSIQRDFAAPQEASA